MRIVIGVHRRWSHFPLAAIHRLTDLGQLTAKFEFAGAKHIAHFVVASNSERAVIPPLVGIADLVGDSMKFFQRMLLGRGRHPGERIDVLPHGIFDFFHHLLRSLLGFRTEILFYIDLA